jgi:cephalosporin hydroxylase
VVENEFGIMNETPVRLEDLQMRGAVLIKALEAYDQKELLKKLGLTATITASRLVPVAMQAMQEGFVHSVQVRTPVGRILQAVDLNSFQQQMDAFVEKSTANFHTLLTQKPASRSLRSRLSNYPRTLIQKASANSSLLRFMELYLNSPEDSYRLAKGSVFPPIQIAFEFQSLLRLLSERPPRNILEIGTANGGTLYLLTKVASKDATIVTMDLNIRNEPLFASFRRHQQNVLLLQGDSTSESNREKIGKIFPEGVDFLFIDGDHSYDGAKTDFINYSPLVKPGGLIAFHDVVESYDERFGLLTECWTGGVPRLWKEIKQGFEYREFIQDPMQDGFGIGVLFKP